ncbi:50S ribosomal protein L30 [gamma proteobacterium HdN1]|nr:50S ribosomal protein L30 [gamma proteobacterium HdN1]
MSDFVTIRLVKSTSGRLKKHQGTVKALGLRRIGHSTQVRDTVEVRGMINSVSHLVKVEG